MSSIHTICEIAFSFPFYKNRWLHGHSEGAYCRGDRSAAYLAACQIVLFTEDVHRMHDTIGI